MYTTPYYTHYTRERAYLNIYTIHTRARTPDCDAWRRRGAHVSGCFQRSAWRNYKLDLIEIQQISD